MRNLPYSFGIITNQNIYFMNFHSIPGFKFSKLIFFILFSMLFHTYVSAQKVPIAEISNWIQPHQADLAYKPTVDELSGGFYYLMADKQENIGLESMYTRYVIHISNSQGVQNMSDISCEYDPRYQKLTFNKIQIIRNGQYINKLLSNPIKTVQRESEMERFSLDGRLTAFVNLTDVRAGDIIDYSYTITGYNPVNSGHYYREFYFDFTLPLHQQYLRLLVPEKLKLNFMYSGDKINPEVAKTSSGTEYKWEISSVKALVLEEEIPAWYNPARRVSITDFSKWKDIVDWIIKDYTISDAEKAKIGNLMAGVLKSGNVDAKITEAVKFVQDDIRYLGFESGLSAYIPNAPAKVLARRYGDCKDKSLLLCAILQSIGVAAYPVLVNSNGLPEETILQPSPDVFNHCIVQVFHNNKYWYVDPTFSSQGGNAESVFTPGYGEGLVLRNGTEGTTQIEGNGETNIKIVSTYNLDSIGGNAQLKVHTSYEGDQADINRSYFASNTLDEISKSYIDFYNNTYPEIKVSEKIVFSDDREKNIFIVDETYLIKNFWEKSKDNPKKINSSYYPFTLRTYLNVPTDFERKMPFKLIFPAHVVEQIEINLPESWQVKPNSKLVNDPAYFFTYTSSGTASQIRLYYEYKSLSDHIDLSKIDEHVKGINTLLDEFSGYQLIYDTTGAKPFNFSWLMGLIALVVLLVSSYFAVRVYFNYDLPSQSDTFLKTEIGGWLVLIAINLIISPIYIIYGLFVTNTFFDTKTIEIIFNQSTSDSHLWSMLLILELVYNVFIVVFLVLLLVLFFKRRTILPRMIMAYYALSFIVNTIDYILARQILNTGFENTDSGKSMGQSFIIAAIWIPYFIYSNRVKRTFTVKFNPNQNTQENDTSLPTFSDNSLEIGAIPVENRDPNQTPDLLKDHA